MNRGQRSSVGVIHHRLLEGILLRLARLPDAGPFILRGGMLLRLWFRPLARPAVDLDLAATFPLGVEETARRFVPLLADRSVDDGVIFDTERVSVQGIWLNTAFPGVRVRGCGEVDGVEDEFSVDVTFGESLVPQLGDYPMLGSPLTARLWMCRPETIIGRKVYALLQLGTRHWRPKDLEDLRLLLGRMPLNRAELPEVIARTLLSRGNRPADARSLFRRQSWWSLKMSTARWQDFARQFPGQQTQANLARVVEEVSGRLGPILELLS